MMMKIIMVVMRMADWPEEEYHWGDDDDDEGRDQGDDGA